MIRKGNSLAGPLCHGLGYLSYVLYDRSGQAPVRDDGGRIFRVTDEELLGAGRPMGSFLDEPRYE